eukprot:Plantae.Rhodophyta-Purpureofilum_apyrenoidigerum.ctg31725.p1 GENE.Plantae.Rhodophyta-Purpureofilum_apyrenoidigerum.ctg31725~~Plantae.Rhodophyta-Purpureofilum_apyrenoidigerum.ctg31725.p1  ORF type:complete len:327 (-),score=49.94 Plantae.Rhodophyta-Purpureofilum_apyrenoidigerum.ctg31725:511-1491(-)
MEDDVRLEQFRGRTYRVRSKWGESVSVEDVVQLTDDRGTAPDLYECALQLEPDEAKELEVSIRRIEKATDTQIEVRSHGSRVSGGTREAVLKARDEVENLRGGKKHERRGYTHFVVLPLAAEWVQEKVASLQEKISALDMPEVSEACMANPERLHCVICMLKLRTPESLSLAKGALQMAGLAVLKLTGGASVIAKIGGVNCVPETKPRSATSVHLDVSDADSTGHGILNSVCAAVCRELRKAGVLDEDAMRQQQILRQGEFRPALYMTIMTAKGGGLSHFNAAVILDRMRDSSVGSIAINEIRLASVNAFDSSGFFRSDSSVSLGR